MSLEFKDEGLIGVLFSIDREGLDGKGWGFIEVRDN